MMRPLRREERDRERGERQREERDRERDLVGRLRGDAANALRGQSDGQEDSDQLREVESALRHIGSGALREGSILGEG